MHKDHFRLIVFKKQQTGEELWKLKSELPFGKRNLHLQGESPSQYQEEGSVCVCVCVCVCCHVRVFVTL